MTFTIYNQFMSDLYSGGIEYAASRAATLGFSGVEFLDFCGTGEPIDKEKYGAAEVKAALETYGLSVDCYSVYANVLHPDRAYFESEIRREIDYAAAVGAKIFHHTVIPQLSYEGEMPKYDDVFEKVLEIEREIANYCAERGLELIFEPQGMFFNGVEGLSRLIKTLREEFSNVGFCADLGNPVYVDSDAGEIIDALSFCLEHVHVKDYIVSDVAIENKEGALSLGGKFLYEVLPGEGGLDLVGYLKKLKNVGYDGRISLEYECDDETMKKTVSYIAKLWEE